MTKVVVACGALALHIDQIAKRRGWDIEVRPLPPELHSRPERIAPAVDKAAGGEDVLVAYADCGTRGALDGYRRLEGAHCYDLFAGESRLAAFLDDMVDARFMRSQQREVLIFDSDPETLLTRLAGAQPPPLEKWLSEAET